MSKNHSHDEALDALCGCAATVTVLSYEEAIKSYFSLRGWPDPETLSTLTPARAEGFKLPRLTDAMIRAACKGHYGDDNIDGICLTVHGTDYSFRDGFKRMWAAIRALKDAPDHG